jgi:Fic family protein
MNMETRAGEFIVQKTGYEAFVPKPLPPEPPLHFDDEMHFLISEADRNLGRLDAASNLLPNPKQFIRVYALKEAVFSSQIEGTQSTLNDILRGEAERTTSPKDLDRKETLNYETAMNHGIERLKEFPVSLRLIREIHAKLMDGVRGHEKEPGEFRRSQNWIGGTGPSDASFVPPPISELNKALSDLELFIHSETRLPHLVKSAVIHAQFETIHPFLDGNGRVGRLLITFLLMENGVLSEPILYPSLYFRANRAKYYTALQAVRTEGAWEKWVKFFLTAIGVSASDAYRRALEVVKFREFHRAMAAQKLSSRSTLNIQMLEQLFFTPYFQIGMMAGRLGVTVRTATRLTNEFEAAGLIHEVTGRQRDKIYRYTEYLELLNRDLQVI